MMKHEYNKIFWRIGQEITPETFIQADNYLIAQQNLIRKFLNRRYYGLLPVDEGESPSLTVTATLNGIDVYIEQLSCHGTTKDGSLIAFNGRQLRSIPCRLSLAAHAPGIYYVVLRVCAFQQTLVEPIENEETPYAVPEYQFDIKELKQIDDNEMPVLKIDYYQQYPVIDWNYIPPCMAVCSCQKLMEQYMLLKQAVVETQSLIAQKRDQFPRLPDPLMFHIFDLEQFSFNEPPWYLIQLLKKVIKTIVYFDRNVHSEHIIVIHAPYNHDDIVGILQSFAKCFQDIQQYIGKKVVVIEEEDFTPRI